MNKQVLEKFYKIRNKSEVVSENNVLLERFITNTYLQKYITPKKSVVEIGAGIRAYAPEIVKYAKNVLAVDLFQENLDRLSNKKINTLCADITNLKSVKSGSFDVVFVNGPMSHLFADKERAKAINESFRICKRGGVVLFNYLINTPIIYRLGLIKGNINALKKYDKRMEKDIYATYFVNDFNKLVSKTKMKHVCDISLDGLFEIFKEHTNKVSKTEFNAIKQMQLQICERTDMIGCSTHVLSIYKKV
jgi:SAM-dependent methyltransferase